MQKYKSLIFAFLGFFIFFSITISGKPIFYSVYEVTSPATNLAQNGVINITTLAFKKIKNFSYMLIDNSEPSSDVVRTKVAAPAKALPESSVILKKAEVDPLIKYPTSP